MSLERRILSPEEVAAAESTYEPGYVPQVVWNEHLRLEAGVTFELTPWRMKDGKIQVYMVRRPEADPTYPNQLHMPGKMANGSDINDQQMLRRVLDTELSEFIYHPPEKIASYLRKTPRGTEGVFQHLLQVINGGNENDWYDAENLPSDVIENHKEMVQIALPFIRAKGSRKQTAAFE